MDFHGTSGNDTINQKNLGIAAGDALYGEDGDDTITLYDGKAIGGAGNNTLISTGADTTVVYWNSPQGVTVNLATGKASNGFGGTDTITGFQRVFGSGSNDTIIGNADDNIFAGLGGSDVFNGGGGNDRVLYFFSKSTDAKVSYDAATDTFTVVKNFANGDKGTDILKGIGSIEFSGAGSDETRIYREDYTSNVKYTLAGIWDPLPGTANAAVVPPFYGQVGIGAGQQPGIVLGSWAYQDRFGGEGQPLTVNAALLAPQADGTLKLSNTEYWNAATTQGIGSVNIADFNGDGRQDIFMAAHNESPFVAVSSVAWLSNAAGGFDRVEIGDKVLAHDAQLAYVNGVPTVFARTFTPGDYNPSYQYLNGKFVEIQEGGGTFTSMGTSTAMADFNNDGKLETVISDIAFGPGYPNLPTNTSRLLIYDLESFRSGAGAPLATLGAYFDERAEYANVASEWGLGRSHIPRTWTDDFNHDGLIDIIASVSLWKARTPSYPSALQMLQNAGQMQFVDVTDTLNKGMDKNGEELDYSMQRVDLDHSGIASYLSASGGAIEANGHSRASNYLWVNDGTGQLHVALHDEFIALNEGMLRFLERSPEVKASGNAVNADNPNYVAKFIPYVHADGILDFLAFGTNQHLLTNVTLHYNVTTDFKQAITISDRNMSKLMRTFAGDDRIGDSHANGATHIDGGLGLDTASYQGKLAAYKVGWQADGAATVTSKPGSATAIADTLVNVERLAFADVDLALANSTASNWQVSRAGNGGLQLVAKAGGSATSLAGVERILFSDGALALDAGGVGGQVYRVYQAAFDRKPDLAGVGYWLAQMDNGTSLRDVANSFIQSKEFTDLYGPNPSADVFITKLYNNVLHRAPEQAGYDYWLNVVKGGGDRAEVLAAFSEGAENQAQVIGVIKDGFAYTPFG